MHGETYDYSRIEYLNNHTKVEIVCPKHGSFHQTLKCHVDKQAGCPKCIKTYTDAESFIQRATGIHGGLYDYSLVVYVDSNKTKVRILCSSHGPFEVIPGNHITKKSGCPECSGTRMNTNLFTKKLYQIYPSFPHSLEKFCYVKATKKATFVCKEHGDYLATPNMVLSGKGGCPKCCGRNKTTEEFLAEVRARQPELFGLCDYSQTNYLDTGHKITVGCSKHNLFRVSPSNHLRGQGCPKCNVSTGQLRVRSILESSRIQFEEEHTFQDLRGSSGTKFRFDFYLPDYKVAIEYDGLQHFQPVKWSSSWTDEQAQQELEAIQQRDAIKTQYCLDHGIQLIRIKYNQQVSKVLEAALLGQ